MPLLKKSSVKKTVMRSEFVGCLPGIRTASLPEILQCDGLCFDMMTFSSNKKENPWKCQSTLSKQFFFKRKKYMQFIYFYPRKVDELKLCAFGYLELKEK